MDDGGYAKRPTFRPNEDPVLCLFAWCFLSFGTAAKCDRGEVLRHVEEVLEGASRKQILTSTVLQASPKSATFPLCRTPCHVYVFPCAHRVRSFGTCMRV